jgi:hypothetical protein
MRPIESPKPRGLRRREAQAWHLAVFGRDTIEQQSRGRHGLFLCGNGVGDRTLPSSSPHSMIRR